MSSVKEHYEQHLAPVYSWMCGDLNKSVTEFTALFNSLNLDPVNQKVLDLGCGHGIQSIALAKLGYQVTAMDYNNYLIKELNSNRGSHPIKTVLGDIRDLSKFNDLNPGLIVCAGDTLTHLESFNEIEQFLETCCDVLESGGYLFLSFRDYSTKLNGDDRFVPVKSDANRIMTCFLEYQPTQVKVTDIIHERTGDTWTQKVHSYDKFRISDSEVKEMLTSCKMSIHSEQIVGGLITIVAQK